MTKQEKAQLVKALTDAVRISHIQGQSSATFQFNSGFRYGIAKVMKDLGLDNEVYAIEG